MTVRRRLRNMKTLSGRRISERRSQSIFLVIIFLAFFACIVLTEVFLVDKEDGGEASIWKKLGYPSDEQQQEKPPERDTVLSPRITRELSRVAVENGNNDSGEYAEYDKLDNGTNGRSVIEDQWQPVKATRDKFFVFSAYYDDRKTRIIRVIAAARTRIAERVSCVFWFGNDVEPTTVFATNKLIRENWNLKYSAYFLLCPLRRDIVGIPRYVSILKQGTSESSNKLTVHNNKAKHVEPKGLAVCVKPLHYNYNKMMNFVEFIELNRLMGVSHFVLYNHTVGENVSCAIDYYQKRGLVSLLPWKLDMISQKEIRTEGLFAALNDCLYRTMYRFRYVLMIDLDEYVIPHSNTTLTAMLNYLSARNPNRIGSFSFQNSFFYLQWPDDPNSKNLPRPLITLQKTKRKAKFHAHKQRSKCIVMPERVVEMGNHFVWEFMPGKICQNVHPDTAFLHHYRVCEFGGSDCINTTATIDQRVYVWIDNLVKATGTSLDAIQPNCKLKDILELNRTIDKPNIT